VWVLVHVAVTARAIITRVLMLLLMLLRLARAIVGRRTVWRLLLLLLHGPLHATVRDGPLRAD
jgi:hypothetical protein